MDKEFISDLGVIPSASGPMTIFCDNTRAIALAKQSRFHKRIKNTSSDASTPFVKRSRMETYKFAKYIRI